MLPSPSTADPSVTTATVLRLIVSRRASAGFSAMARQTRATPGVYARDRSSRCFSATFGLTSILPPRCSRNVRSETLRTLKPSRAAMALVIDSEWATSLALQRHVDHQHLRVRLHHVERGDRATRLGHHAGQPGRGGRVGGRLDAHGDRVSGAGCGHWASLESSGATRRPNVWQWRWAPCTHPGRTWPDSTDRGGDRVESAAGHRLAGVGYLVGAAGLPRCRCTPTRSRSGRRAWSSRPRRRRWCPARGCWPGRPTPTAWSPSSAPGWPPAPCRRSPGSTGTLVVAALLDLHVLSQTYGVPVAGWTPGLALRLAAGLGVRRGRAGPDRSPGRRRADLGLPGPDATRPRESSRPATGRTGRGCRTRGRTTGRGRLGAVGDGPGGRGGLPAATGRPSCSGTGRCWIGPPPRRCGPSTIRARCRRPRPTTGR